MWSHRLEMVGKLSVLSGSSDLRIFVGLVPFVRLCWCGGVPMCVCVCVCVGEGVLLLVGLHGLGLRFCWG